jgi:hypothetical protein
MIHRCTLSAGKAWEAVQGSEWGPGTGTKAKTNAVRRWHPEMRETTGGVQARQGNSKVRAVTVVTDNEAKISGGGDKKKLRGSSFQSSRIDRDSTLKNNNRRIEQRKTHHNG